MSPSSFQPSFFRFALNLPDSAPVRTLRLVADETYRQLGGYVIEEHIAAYTDIFSRWRAGGDDSPGLREAMRAMGARERGVARLEKLREQAWLQARAEVFQQTGERIPLPQTPESAARGENTRVTREPLRQVSDLEAQAGKMPQPVGPNADPAPDSQAAGEPLTNKQIKVALQRLISARVDRTVVEALRAEAVAGRLTKAEFVQVVEELLGIRQAA